MLDDNKRNPKVMIKEIKEKREHCENKRILYAKNTLKTKTNEGTLI